MQPARFCLWCGTALGERLIEGKRLGLVSNPASVDSRLVHASDRLFNSGDWTGQLLSFPVQTTGANIGTLLDADWEASQKLPIGSRKIITTNTDGPSPVAVAFDCGRPQTNLAARSYISHALHLLCAFSFRRSANND